MGFLSVVTHLVVFVSSLGKVSARSVGFADLAWVFTIGRDDLVQLDDARVTELEEVVEFAIGTFGVGDVLKGVAYFFNRKNLLRLFVSGFVDLPVGALPHKAQYFIGLINVIVNIRLVFLHL